MSRFIEVNKINSHNNYSETDEIGENTAPPTDLCIINVDAIRCFYPRKDSMPGTRITFTDGGGFAVSNPYDDVKAMIHQHP